MTRLIWDAQNQRSYEMGIDRGVLYPSSGPGVTWNGLISVKEEFIGGDVRSYYLDGLKYLDAVSNRDFQATIRSFSVPSQFAVCLGETPIKPGIYLTRQLRQRFGMSYRTVLGPDHYKIHLVYNALAFQTSRSYNSISDSPQATAFEFKVNTVPPGSATYYPTAHLVLDSSLISAPDLAQIEDILYGTNSVDPALPVPTVLQTILTT